MPQPAEIPELERPLVEVYSRAWAGIVAQQEALAADPLNLTKRRRMLEMQRSIAATMAGLDIEAAQWVAERLPEVYRLGAVLGVSEATGGAGEFTWSQIHREAVQELSGPLFKDLLDATQYVNKTTKELVRRVAKDVALNKAIQGKTAVQAGREMQRLLGEHGISAVVYRDGSAHGLAEYTQMAIRTTTATGYNHGTINAGADNGVVAWEVFDGPDCGWSEHDDAQIANGMIVSKDDAFEFVISHPNCRRAFGARPDLAAPGGRASQVTKEQIDAQRAQDAARVARQQRVAATRAAQLDKRQARIRARADKVVR